MFPAIKFPSSPLLIDNQMRIFAASSVKEMPLKSLRAFVPSCLPAAAVRRHGQNFVPSKILVSILVLLAISLTTSAQTKTTTSREQLWLAYFNQTRVTDKFGFWLDVQQRQTGDFVDRPFQLLLRPAVTWYAKDNFRVNLGYAFINHFPAEGNETSQPEHRIWEQVWFSQKLPNLTMLQWLRFEQRFIRKIANDELVDGYTRANRLRYNIGLSIPLKGKELKPGTPFVSVSNELFINFGKNVVYNTFDQNRLFLGLGYQITSGMNLQGGYLNAYQQLASGNSYVVSHAVRIALFQNIDLRAK
jgi:hypothetical protein